jgi:periplasmic protein TonB
MYHLFRRLVLKEIGMLAYAAHRRTVAGRKPAPHALLVIIVAHIALIAAVMSAKMDLPQRIPDITKVRLIPAPSPPPPQPEPKAEPKSAPSTVDRMPVIVPVAQPRLDNLDPTPVPTLDNRPVIQPRVVAEPVPGIAAVAPLRIAARFATPASDLRPPYPLSKLDLGQEAVLRLRLTIDERGRVTSVEPVGAADPAFLAAARKHLLAKWRYKPATEDGRPVRSSTQISLRFELER